MNRNETDMTQRDCITFRIYRYLNYPKDGKNSQPRFYLNAEAENEKYGFENRAA